MQLLSVSIIEKLIFRFAVLGLHCFHTNFPIVVFSLNKIEEEE